MTPPPSDYSLQRKFIYFVTNIDSRAAAAAGPRGHNILAKKANVGLHTYTRQTLLCAALSAGSLSYTYATVCSGGAEKANIDRSGIGRKRNENSGTDVPPLVHNSTAGGTHSLSLSCRFLLYVCIFSLSLYGCVFFACRASERAEKWKEYYAIRRRRRFSLSRAIFIFLLFSLRLIVTPAAVVVYVRARGP